MQSLAVPQPAICCLAASKSSRPMAGVEVCSRRPHRTTSHHRAAAAAFASRRSSRSFRVAAQAPAAAPTPSPTAPHLQLATARLPADIDRDAFLRSLYQWAATLTSSGRNLPFALPLDVVPLAAGLKISLLRVVEGGSTAPLAEIAATVEPVEGAGNVLMVRLYEGPAAAALGVGGPPPPAGAPLEAQQERLQRILAGLVDVPVIMETMKDAIKRAVVVAR